MKITPIKTEKITSDELNIESFLNRHIPDLNDLSIVAISSKIISYMEKRRVPLEQNLEQLIEREADHVIKGKNKYGRLITVKFNALISAAGIDQSNGNNAYVLLPSDPQKTAREVYNHLEKRFKNRRFGVIICDSRSIPLRAGAMGVAIGFHGFKPLKNYIGKKDIFGRPMKYERANVVDALAVSAVLAMGEGGEQTPVAIIEDVGSIVEFSRNQPSKKELREFYISLEDDIFHPFYE